MIYNYMYIYIYKFIAVLKQQRRESCHLAPLRADLFGKYKREDGVIRKESQTIV